ncbi:hypothetical protein D3C74_407770 [compost metagenome]
MIAAFIFKHNIDGNPFFQMIFVLIEAVVGCRNNEFLFCGDAGCGCSILVVCSAGVIACPAASRKNKQETDGQQHGKSSDHLHPPPGIILSLA